MILVETHDGLFGTVTIFRSKADGSHLYYQDQAFQSQGDAQGTSHFPYIHAMRAVMVGRNARRIAVLGCAGGTLASMMARAGAAVTAVDIDPFAFSAARRFFGLPDSVRCVCEDGRRFLERSRDHFDAIALDLFDGSGVPPHLYSAEFFHLVRTRLTVGGILLVNVIVDHDHNTQADVAAAGIREAGLPAHILDPGGFDRNLVVVGGTVSGVTIPIGDEPLEVLDELERMRMR